MSSSAPQPPGLPAAVYQAAVSAYLAELVGAAAIWKRVSPAGLAAALAHGRFNSLFEAIPPGGALAFALRNNTEVRVLGVDAQRQPASLRPQYGFLSPDPDGGGLGARLQGAVALRCLPAVRERSTFTCGESLEATQGGRLPLLAPQPVVAPSFQAVDFRYGGLPRAPFRIDPLRLAAIDQWWPYAEVQIHGGLRVADLAEAVFDLPPTGDLAAALQQHGLPWRVVPRMPRGGPAPATPDGRIVAHEAGRAFLIDRSEGVGQVLDLDQGRLFPPFNLYALWTAGRLWEDYTGPQIALPVLLAQTAAALMPDAPALRSTEDVQRWLWERGFGAASPPGPA